MKSNKKYIPLISIIVLSGCAVGSDFSRPSVIKNDSYVSKDLDITLEASQHIVGGDLLYQNWWQEFGSDKLNTLVNKAIESNPTLQAAEATLRQSQELYNARSGSTLYPQVGGNFSSSHQRSNPAIMSGQEGAAKEFSLYSAGANISYMFDLFGGNKRALESLAAKSDYQKYKLDGARLSLAANVVTSAITQAGIFEQIKITREILNYQKEQVNLSKKKLKFGQIGENEVLALQTKMDQTRANLAVLESGLQQSKHQLAILIGQEPNSTDVPSFVLGDFILPENLPLLVPSELVHSRPDILASESLLKAANAEYGVAVAKLYPQITLGADIGSLALSSSALFGSGSAIWSLVAQITQPLFNPGLPAERRAALAAFDAAVANYKMVVLEALRDVADILYILDGDSKKLDALSAANIASRKSLRSAESSYKLGAVSYFELLVAQEQNQKVEMDLIDAQAKMLINSVAFFQAMGKG